MEIALSELAARALFDASENGLIDSGTLIKLNLMLDIGMIDCSIKSDYRVGLPGKLFSGYKVTETASLPEGTAEKEWTEMGKSAEMWWDIFTSCVKDGENVRIWVSERPDSLCALMLLCDYLKDMPTDVFVVKLPVGITRGQQDEILNCWESVPGKGMDQYCSLQERLSWDAEIAYAQEWKRLKQENSMLRTVIAGKVVSVDEDFYDFWISRQIPDQPIVQEKVVEDSLNEGIPVVSGWINLRIQEMINLGKLRVVQDAEDVSERVLLKADRVLERQELADGITDALEEYSNCQIDDMPKEPERVDSERSIKECDNNHMDLPFPDEDPFDWGKSSKTEYRFPWE